MDAPTPRIAEPAVESDIPYLVDIYYNAFHTDRLRTIFPATESGRRWVQQAFVKHLAPSQDIGPETKVLVSRSSEGECQLRNRHGGIV